MRLGVPSESLSLFFYSLAVTNFVTHGADMGCFLKYFNHVAIKVLPVCRLDTANNVQKNPKNKQPHLCVCQIGWEQ